MMQGLADAVLRQLEATHAGHPWYGPSRSELLDDITWQEATVVPPGDGPSIWGLVLHMTAWTREVARRLAGATPGVPADGDWPALPARPSARGWATARRRLDAAHAEVREAAGRVAPSAWVTTIRWADGGSDPATLADTLVGLAQHDAYHAGQVALTRRVVRAAR